MSKLGKKQLKRIGIDIAGFGLIILSPFVSLLPGPGGLPVFLAGLGILSLNYKWASDLLKNFEKRYNEFVEKYLVSNKTVGLTIDILSVFTIASGIFILLNAEHFLILGLAFGMTSFGLIILVSNQRRFARFKNKIFKKHKQK